MRVGLLCQQRVSQNKPGAPTFVGVQKILDSGVRRMGDDENALVISGLTVVCNTIL
jgi:hypothetical protein